MSPDETFIDIDYYNDVLCVWAWIAQPRLDELHRQWGDQLRIRHRFVDIFGDARHKIPARWGETEGFDRFRRHVVESAAPFEHITVHGDVWTNTRPRSSQQAHLLLRAAGLVAGQQQLQALALRIRRAFFAEGRDVSDMSTLLALASEQGLDTGILSRSLEDGSAMAALSSDLHSATQLGVRGSPTWILNEGRQVLYGNVGYRILAANIEELLNHPGEEASWC